MFIMFWPATAVAAGIDQAARPLAQNAPVLMHVAGMDVPLVPAAFAILGVLLARPLSPKGAVPLTNLQTVCVTAICALLVLAWVIDSHPGLLFAFIMSIGVGFSGFSIDAIMAKLTEMDVEVSRSALGRHVRGLAEVGEKMRRTREITETLARMGNRADNKMLRGTIELLNSILLEVSLAEEEGEDGQFRPVQFNALQIKALAQTAESLARAEKIDADREMKIKEDANREAAKRASEAGKAKGLGKETVEFIANAVLGVA